MKYIYVFAIMAVMLAPLQSVSAYQTTDQSAVRVTGSAALYAIEFEFGHGDHKVHIPILARETTETSRDLISYSLINDEDERAAGMRSAGIVFSNAPIENGEYVVPKGTKATFTLLVVATATDDAPTQNVHAAVTYLPFNFDGTEELQLNPSELQYYKTPARIMPINVQLHSIEFTISED